MSRLAGGMASRTQATTVRDRRQRTATTAPSRWSTTNNHTKAVRDRSDVHVRRSRSTRSCRPTAAVGVTTPPPTVDGGVTPARCRNVRLTSGRVARWSSWVEGEPRPAEPRPQAGEAARTPRCRFSSGVDALATRVHVPSSRSRTSGRPASWVGHHEGVGRGGESLVETIRRAPVDGRHNPSQVGDGRRRLVVADEQPSPSGRGQGAADRPQGAAIVQVAVVGTEGLPVSQSEPPAPAPGRPRRRRRPRPPARPTGLPSPG